MLEKYQFIMYKKRQKPMSTLKKSIYTLGAILLGACFSGFIISKVSKVSPQTADIMTKSNSIT